MPSSVIRSFRYDQDRGELDIEFVGGRVYRYVEVPASAASALAKAVSPGRFFNERIRDHFPFRRLRPERNYRGDP